MLSKPTHWDELWGADGTICDYQIVIGSEVYTGEDDIEDRSLILDKNVFTAKKPVGNTPCFTMECCLRQHDTPIPRGAILQLQMRLKNKTVATEWINYGEYKIHNRQEYTDGWVKLTCRDRMQMANQSYIQPGDTVTDDTWPKSMKWFMETTVSRIGVTLDPRTEIQEGDDWMIPLPLGMTIRAVWSNIAAAHGGNFIITPQQTLLLTHPKFTSDTTAWVPVDDNVEDLVYDVNGAYISQLTLKYNQLEFSAGEPGDNNLVVECQYLSQGAANYALDQLSDILYLPGEATGVVFNPLAEIQDTYGFGSTPVIWSRLTTVCGITQLSDGGAEAMAEPASEYGFEDTIYNSLVAKINGVSARIDDVAEEALSELTQESIFNKLTNNGEAQGFFIQGGQIYINASYLASGTIQASMIKSGILESKDGSFSLNLDTGQITMRGAVTQDDLDALREGGIEKLVTPVMKYSFSDEGLQIQKPGEEIKNMIDNTGMEVSRSGSTMLRADKDGVIATDVKVNNFLHMGAHSRFEDYSDGTDTQRTGCFAI